MPNLLFSIAWMAKAGELLLWICMQPGTWTSRRSHEKVHRMVSLLESCNLGIWPCIRYHHKLLLKSRIISVNKFAGILRNFSWHWPGIRPCQLCSFRLENGIIIIPSIAATKLQSHTTKNGLRAEYAGLMPFFIQWKTSDWTCGDIHWRLATVNERCKQALITLHKFNILYPRSLPKKKLWYGVWQYKPIIDLIFSPKSWCILPCWHCSIFGIMLACTWQK